MKTWMKQTFLVNIVTKTFIFEGFEKYSFDPVFI